MFGPVLITRLRFVPFLPEDIKHPRADDLWCNCGQFISASRLSGLEETLRRIFGQSESGAKREIKDLHVTKKRAYSKVEGQESAV